MKKQLTGVIVASIVTIGTIGIFTSFQTININDNIASANKISQLEYSEKVSKPGDDSVTLINTSTKVTLTFTSDTDLKENDILQTKVGSRQFEFKIPSDDTVKEGIAVTLTFDILLDKDGEHEELVAEEPVSNRIITVKGNDKPEIISTTEVTVIDIVQQYETELTEEALTVDYNNDTSVLETNDDGVYLVKEEDASLEIYFSDIELESESITTASVYLNDIDITESFSNDTIYGTNSYSNGGRTLKTELDTGWAKNMNITENDSVNTLTIIASTDYLDSLNKPDKFNKPDTVEKSYEFTVDISTGLSGGAIAGIVIGVLAVVGLIAGGGYYFYTTKKTA